MKKIVVLGIITIFTLSLTSCKKICYCDVKDATSNPIYPKIEVNITSEKKCLEFVDPHWDSQGYLYQCYVEK